MSASLNLYRLQQADTRLALAHSRQKAIAEALASDAETREANRQQQTAHEARVDAERALNEAEFQAQSTRVKIDQAESSLYGGHVGNPKELQDLQKDAESLRRHLVALEDSQLEAMLALEEAEQAEAAAQASLDLASAKSEGKKRSLVTEQDTIQGEIESLESERRAIAGSVDPATLQHYDSLRAQKRGIAVAALNDGTCGACGGPLTPADQQSVHIGQGMIHCPTCGRILYAG